MKKEISKKDYMSWKQQKSDTSTKSESTNSNNHSTKSESVSSNNHSVKTEKVSSIDNSTISISAKVICKISGRVERKDYGLRIPNANIILYRNIDPIAKVYSGADGNYLLTDIDLKSNSKSDEYFMRCVASGYKMANRPILLIPGGDIKVDFELEKILDKTRVH